MRSDKGFLRPDSSSMEFICDWMTICPKLLTNAIEPLGGVAPTNYWWFVASATAVSTLMLLKLLPPFNFNVFAPLIFLKRDPDIPKGSNEPLRCNHHGFALLSVIADPNNQNHLFLASITGVFCLASREIEIYIPIALLTPASWLKKERTKAKIKLS